MDIVEYAEKVIGVELFEWQKEALRRLNKLPPGEKVVYVPRAGKSGIARLDLNHLKELYKALYPEKGEMDENND